jgi:integrase/recombinase XerC
LPWLSPEEAPELIDRTEITTPAGLRHRALIGLMVFSFARIGAALGMKVEDIFTQDRRLWVRLREKGGKALTMPPQPRNLPHRLHRGCAYRSRSPGAAVSHHWSRHRVVDADAAAPGQRQCDDRSTCGLW